MRFLFFTLLIATIGCDGKELETCTDGELRCSAEVLEECGADGEWATVEDCSESDKMCHAEMGHCM